MQDPNHRQKWRYFFPGGRTFWILMTLIVSYSCFIAWIDDHGFDVKKILDADSAFLADVVVGMLLVFRINSAYDRWWEGRKIWGQLVNDTRNLAIKAGEYVRPSGAERERFAKLLGCFAYALKDHLRGWKASYAPYSQFASDSCGSKPIVIAQQIYKQLHAWSDSNILDGFQTLQLDRHARYLMDALGASERILKSPIAGTYKTLIWLGLGAYFLIVPWLLVPTIDNWAILACAASGYFVVCLELLAEEVEEPFGIYANDLPLDAICKSLEGSVEDILAPSLSETETDLLENKSGITS